MNQPLKQILREVAQEKRTSVAELRRAIAQGEMESVTTKEEVLRCWDGYAGPEIKKLRLQHAAQRRVHREQQDLIETVGEQLQAHQDASQQRIELQQQIIVKQAEQIRWLAGENNSSSGKA
ncbi:MAG: hypothetical protein AAGG51_21305 [Cyanobacteria bacterium P01_G01_bin.54]